MTRGRRPFLKVSSGLRDTFPWTSLKLSSCSFCMYNELERWLSPAWNAEIYRLLWALDNKYADHWISLYGELASEHFDCLGVRFIFLPLAPSY